MRRLRPSTTATVVLVLLAASCETTSVTRPWRHQPPRAELPGRGPSARIALSPTPPDPERVSPERGERLINRRATEVRPEARARGPEGGGRAAGSPRAATLGKDSLDKALRDRFSAIASCYGEGEPLPGSLELTVAADGTLLPASAQIPSCVAGILRSVRLPSAAGSRVNYSMPAGWAMRLDGRIAP